jgi:hypothetical protein
MSTEWKLVPVEPTPEMIAANGSSAAQSGRAWLAQDARETWAAMLDLERAGIERERAKLRG